MTSKEFYREFGNIDPKMVEAAAPAEKERGNKKKVLVKWMTIAACIALLLTMVGTVWALTLQTPKSTYDTISDLAETKDGVFKLDVLDQKEVFANLSRDNMREIFNALDIVLEKNHTIEIKDTMYHRELLDHEAIEYSLTNDIDLEHIYLWEDNGEQIVLNHEGRIIISTNQDHNVLKYAIFTSVYMELFPNSWTYGYTQEQLKSMNDSWIPLVKVIPDYAEYGFDSAFEAFQSFSGRTSEQFTFKRSASFGVNEINYKEMNEIIEDSEDSYLLEYFFYNLSKEKELNQSKDFAMVKKSQTLK